MEHTLLVGDCIVVNKFIYGAKLPHTISLTSITLPRIAMPALKKIQRGDIIVFEFPPEPGRNLIKRCIAIAGDTVEIKNKNVFVNEMQFPREHSVTASQFIEGEPSNDIFPHGSNFNPDFYGPIIVPPHSVFVLGDNHDNSFDSRFWGFVPEENVTGMAMMIYYSSGENGTRWERIGKILR